MSKDSRGVLRGRCTQCQCVQYTRQTADQLLCSGCFHAPAKHLKLDPASVTPFPGQSFGSVSRPTQQYGSQYTASATAAPYTPPQQLYLTNSAPFLKDCAADGCTIKVHYDAELGPFDYCSPGCRDRHLLPLERVRLKRDIEENSTKMATYLPQSSPHLSSAATSTTATNNDNKEKKMVTIEKKPKEELGLITAEIRPGTRLRIVGAQLKTPAYRELKGEKIKLLDIVTELNEEKIFTGARLMQSTCDKTRPMLTLLRNKNTPSIKNLLSKVKARCPSATHVRVAMNPVFIDSATDFGIEPWYTIPMQDMTTGIFLGVVEIDRFTAHLSGVTTRDEVLMYAVMDSKHITEEKIPTSVEEFKRDISRAKIDGKHLILVLRQYPI